MLTYVEGNIFDFEGTITLPVNCKGVMGRGIAYQVKQRDKELYAHYRKLCDQNALKPGYPRMVLSSKYLLFPVKDHWQKPARYEWIDLGLSRIKENEHHLESLAIPRLGCGNGTLEWSQVKPLVEKHLNKTRIQIVVYSLPSDVKNGVL